VEETAPEQRWSRLLILTVGVHAAVLSVTVSRPFFYLVVGSAQRLFHHSISEGNIFDDVHIYFKYASLCFGGEMPYRDFRVEYPILAFPLFVLPRFFTNNQYMYYIAFGVEMLLCDAAIVWLLIRHVGRDKGGVEAVRGRLVWYTLFLAAQGPMPIARFDLAPTLMAFWGALAWFSGRPGRGGALVGLGVLMKIFPGVIAAPALVSPGPGVSRVKGMIALFSTVVVGGAVWFGLGGARVGESLGYHLDRGVELSSLPSNVLILWSKATGEPITTIFAHGNCELVCSASPRAASLAPTIQAALLILVMIMRWRSLASDGLRFAAAAILAFMVANKVLSPQYVIWLLPFMAAIGGRVGRVARPLFLITCVVNFAVYPWSYLGLEHFQPLAIAILTARNGLLAALLCVLLFTRETDSGLAVAVDKSSLP
jgi:Glycosyltransferase family 87